MNTIKKVVKDMFLEQLKWSGWFISINILIHLVAAYYSVKYSYGMADFTQFISASTSIYMLVIGIVAGYSFLNRFTRLGVTRKFYFYGASLAALILSFTIVAIADIFALIELPILNFFKVNIESNIFSGMEWIQPTVSIGLNGLMYYLIGWFINIGYYKFNWRIGLLFIVAAIIFSTIHGYIWVDYTIDIPGVIMGSAVEEAINISGGKLPFGFAAGLDVGLLALLLLMIRRLTKNISVKL